MRFAPVALAGLFFITVPAGAADAPPANTKQPCVDVQIGNDRTSYLNCLNDEMQRRVEHERGTPQITAPIDAHSPSTQVGTFNDAAAREHMGNAYGVSSVPQRPAQVNPIVPPTAR
ncbi:MAG TPA: hypothetical protein VNH44_08395 [Micropepsaceae bacterium]|nr:hypothetical protein [Micropepsaceae bacterium]